MLDDTDDVYYLPYDHADRVEQAMQDYLNWEVALVAQLAREGVRFPAFPGSAQTAGPAAKGRELRRVTPKPPA